MDLDYGPEYEAFRAELRQFLAENRKRAPKARLGDVLAIDPEMASWQQLLIERGYAARTIPKEYGGAGREPDPLISVILAEEFRRAGAPAGVSGQGPDMLVPTLLEHGTEAQKRTYVPPTVRGEMVWCQGYSEPGAGSDLASLTTSGRVEGDTLVVNGQKIWTSTAHAAQMMFALVRTEPDAKKHAGISYVLIPMDTPGIDVRPLRTMTGHAEFNEVFFDDVRVPLENVVGKRGEGWKIANTTLRHERNMLGSAATSEGLFHGLLRTLQQEKVDGRPVLDDPVVQGRVAALQARTVAMRCHAMRLLTARVRGESSGVAGLVTKLNGCQLNHDLAGFAIDGMGEAGTLYRGAERARDGGRWLFHWMFQLGLIIGGGTAQIQKNIISERGLGMPREPKPGAQ
jgi:alkylation response protein AidB-like acyl-CoA dehydrogenase